MITRADKLLTILRESTQTLQFYNAALEALSKSGILDFLRAIHTPRVIGLGADVQVQATLGAFSAGYNQALDDLYEFREKYLEDLNTKATAQMDFGAIDNLLANGYISKEEADGIRSGKRVEYRTIIGNTPASK